MVGSYGGPWTVTGGKIPRARPGISSWRVWRVWRALKDCEGICEENRQKEEAGAALVDRHQTVLGRRSLC